MEKNKNKGGLWKVKRTVVEEFEVWASTKEDALRVEKEPHKITVVKETAFRVQTITN